MEIKCVVCGLFNGEASFFPVIVDVTEKQKEDGEHLVAAENEAEENKFDPYVTAPEGETLFAPFANTVKWASVPHVRVIKVDGTFDRESYTVAG